MCDQDPAKNPQSENIVNWGAITETIELVRETSSHVIVITNPKYMDWVCLIFVCRKSGDAGCAGKSDATSMKEDLRCHGVRRLAVRSGVSSSLFSVKLNYR